MTKRFGGLQSRTEWRLTRARFSVFFIFLNTRSSRSWRKQKQAMRCTLPCRYFCRRDRCGLVISHEAKQPRDSACPHSSYTCGYTIRVISTYSRCFSRGTRHLPSVETVARQRHPPGPIRLSPLLGPVGLEHRELLLGGTEPIGERTHALEVHANDLFPCCLPWFRAVASRKA